MVIVNIYAQETYLSVTIHTLKIRSELHEYTVKTQIKLSLKLHVFWSRPQLFAQAIIQNFKKKAEMQKWIQNA